MQQFSGDKGKLELLAKTSEKIVQIVMKEKRSTCIVDETAVIKTNINPVSYMGSQRLP